jgi:PDDEXK-like domain of unknown function (DUF3799)
MITVRKWNGKPIDMPGIYSGIPIEIYHSDIAVADVSISSTGLRAIFNPTADHATSPAHYWVNSPYNSNRIEKKETESIILGRAAHHLIFGEKKFKETFAIRPEVLNERPWQGNRLECKGWVFDQAAAGMTVVTAEQIEKIKGIADRLLREPMVKSGLLNGLIEHSAFARDPETGVWLRIRPDAMPSDGLDFVDLKIVHSITDRDIQRSIETYGYYQQGALVQTVMKLLTRADINSFTLVFCESAPPHCVKIRTLKPHEIKRGENVNRIGLRKFAKCLSEKSWPGPDDGRMDAAYVEMSEWAGKRIDEAVERETKG